MGKIYQFLFIYFIRKTPEKWGKLRNYFVRKYIKSAGKNMNIGRYCKIHKNTTIGDHSGVGFGCEIPNGVTLGSHVMMGPDVLIFTQNHQTADTERGYILRNDSIFLKIFYTRR